MLKTIELNKALRKDGNFIDGTCLFNMCPEKHKELFANKFWIIECFDLKNPKRKIGVMVWDNENEKLYGPFILKNKETKRPLKNMAFAQGNKIGVPEDLPVENTLEDYRFIKLPSSEIEFYLYFRGKVAADYCISGFREKELRFEQV